MTLSRRRFLAITAAAVGSAAAPGKAAPAPLRWQGRALGAEATLVLHGPRQTAEAALTAALDALHAVEAAFSLYDPASDLVRLNRTGRLDQPSPDWRALMAEARAVHAATGGRFDPTVQPLWHAHAKGGDLAAARAAVGLSKVAVTAEAVTLAPGQALTFNGIAQGFATDRVRAALRDHGLDRTLVNVGEIAGDGGPWRLGLADPRFGLVTTYPLSDGAVATSSPPAMALGTADHILDPTGRRAAALWSTVSVEADSATRADAVSTALCFCDAGEIAAVLRRLPGLRRVRTVDAAGDLRSFTA